ncbi:MAG: CDP-alcohol phosphatidyltransferase family protein [Acidobacteria bacterium]|nr:CDP-alcohol phosphatidyltransferase family protein [Acidobacteriota bacterium]
METDEPNPPHKGLKKGLYLFPTAFTAANILMGFLAVLYSVRGFQAPPDAAASYYDYAALFIGFAILFDTLDGRVARMTRTATEIGVQLDSLADVLTFGIAPTALVYSWGLGGVFSEKSSAHYFAVFILFMYLMCGAFRLARFNLQATRPRVLIEGTAKVDKKNFVGLPIPPAAGLMASIIHFAPQPLNLYGEDTARFYGILVIILLGILGLLMVSTLRYTSFKTVGTGRTNIYIVLLVVAIGMLIWQYSQYMLLILSALYVSHGVIWYLLSLLTPRRKEAQIESQV